MPGLDISTTRSDALFVSRLGNTAVDTGELRYGVMVSVWVRWVALIACMVGVYYRTDSLDYTILLKTLVVLIPLVGNACVHYRIRRNQAVSVRLLLALSIADMMFIAGVIAAFRGFNSALFLLYYPALAIFASVFTSTRLCLVWTTLASVTYAVVSVLAEPGLDIGDGDRDDLLLAARIVSFYTVVMIVNQISRHERMNKRNAIEREQALREEQIELSQAIHDTIAQSAYMIGWGLETAIDLADRSNQELISKLEATYALSRSAMWEVRLPIDIGLIFEGRELNGVLRSHAATFTEITSLPIEVFQSGDEPRLPTATRALLFSIAHNSLTNAFRHSQAGAITISLDFNVDHLRMSIVDDGLGMPADYAERGHGLRNMQRDAQRAGGSLEVDPGGSGRGAAITCVVPYDTAQRRLPT
ncbi:MAG: hypothetical protein F4Y25_02645 [Chloroflexi bacterium]|nr:hypothetical protein [Chloroflexota bacterium]